MKAQPPDFFEDGIKAIATTGSVLIGGQCINLISLKYDKPVEPHALYRFYIKENAYVSGKRMQNEKS
ncbi:MAG: hypothetical protein SGI71_11910 [Verrucomicrobiota bacterium]|nr:hypothetical protein [Verrucomicrobiota bacterium]